MPQDYNIDALKRDSFILGLDMVYSWETLPKLFSPQNKYLSLIRSSPLHKVGCDKA